MSTALEPRYVQPRRWHEALAVARETCARFFADGRSPDDAISSFGLKPSEPTGWAQAVNVIAEIHHASAAIMRVA